jgi:hypothetical protein
MGKHLKLMSFYFWLLGLFTIGRWAISFSGMDYARATWFFSLVPLSLIASAHHAAFARGFKDYGVKDAAALGACIGLVTQVVIFVSTALSYMLGLSTLWNSAAALNAPDAVPFGQAMVARTFGLVVNTILNVIAALIGYAMGGGLKAAK